MLVRCSFFQPKHSPTPHHPHYQLSPFFIPKGSILSSQKHQPQACDGFTHLLHKHVLSTYCAQQPYQMLGIQQRRKQTGSLASLGLPSGRENTLIRGSWRSAKKNKTGRSQRWGGSVSPSPVFCHHSVNQQILSTYCMLCTEGQALPGQGDSPALGPKMCLLNEYVIKSCSRTSSFPGPEQG